MPKSRYTLRMAPRSVAISVALFIAAALTVFIAPNTFGQADDFTAYGTTVDGEVSSSAGEEWFFSGCAGDLVTVDMSSDEFDAYVEIYGPVSRRPIAEDDNSGNDDNALIEEFELPESGVYSIVAAGAARKDRGKYTLALEADGGGDMSDEPTIFYGDSVRGEVSTTRGEEWSFWGCADDVVNFLMESDEFAAYLELYGPTGRRPLVEIGVEDDSDTIEVSEFALPDSGIYTIVAAGLTRRDRGAYSLSLLNSAEDAVGDNRVATATKTPTEGSAAEVEAKPTSTNAPVRSSVPGIIADFETWGDWQRGDQSWGTFMQSSQQAYKGQYAGEFAYKFPANEAQNYLVFEQALPISGSPTALTMWVYGDGSGNYLNAWVVDANQQRWQFTFGRVYHTGWRQMRAPLDLSLGWPNQAVGNSLVSSIEYPIDLAALVLDGADEKTASEGSILVDELSGTIAAATVAATNTPAPQVIQAAQPAQESQAASINVNDLPAPMAVSYDFPAFKWEWEGMPAMDSVDNWYFDLKIFNNEFSEYPYDVKVVEVGNVVAEGPNQWRYDKQADFRCGSYWAIQIAKRNADGSYAGPMSPESNRVPSNQGCGGQPNSNSHGGGNGGGGSCPAWGC